MSAERMPHYEFRPDEFTLADLRIDTSLTPDDKARLQLSLDAVDVRLSPQGEPHTLAEWSNELGLQVKTTNALIGLVSTERLTIAGCDKETWTDVDFVIRFGLPEGRTQLSKPLVELHWRQGTLGAYFFDSELVGFYIAGTE